LDAKGIKNGFENGHPSTKNKIFEIVVMWVAHDCACWRHGPCVPLALDMHDHAWWGTIVSNIQGPRSLIFHILWVPNVSLWVSNT